MQRIQIEVTKMFTTYIQESEKSKQVEKKMLRYDYRDPAATILYDQN